jgi:hypothetical protein
LNLEASFWSFGYEFAVKFKRLARHWSDINGDVVNRADLTVDLAGFPDLNIDMVVSLEQETVL